MRPLLKSRPCQQIVFFLKQHPRLGRIARLFYVPAHWLWKTRAWIRSLIATRGVIHPHKTIRVDPADIVHAMKWDEKGYRKYDDRGRVLGGDWDLRVTPFAETDVFRAFADHFLRGVPWEQTDYYARVLRSIESKTYKRKMADEEDLRARVAYLDQLYEIIRRDGFRPHAELKEDHHPQAGGEDEVTVRIGRHGEFLFEDGRHRLAIAKLQNIRSIPAKVTVRHREWVELVLAIHAFARKHGGRVPQALLHPDLADIPSATGREGLDIICAALPPAPADILDVGCRWGFHCTALERMGYRCTGLEDDETDLRFLRRLRTAHHAGFEVVEGPIRDFRPDRAFDAALALDALQRGLGDPEMTGCLESLLERLETRMLILGCRRQAGAPGCPTPDECISFACRHSRLKHARHLGTESGRLEIYALT